MGGKNSKEPAIEENSSGFHVLEIHAPTMGISIITILILLAVLALAHMCASHLRKKYLRRPRYRNHTIPYHTTHQYPPFFPPEPYNPYFLTPSNFRNSPSASIFELPTMPVHAPPNRRRQQRIAPAAEPATPAAGGTATKKTESAVCTAAAAWNDDN